MKQRYYAIKRPDGSWVMGDVGRSVNDAWFNALVTDMKVGEPGSREAAESAGYRCVEVDGFREVEK